MKTIINDIPIDVVILRKNNKNIYFRIKNDLKLYITCPFLIRKSEIESLIDKNSYQIYKMYEKQIKKVERDEFFNYLGNVYTVITDLSREKVGFENDFVYTPDEGSLKQFYFEKCHEIFTEEIEKCRKCFNKLPEFSLKLRKMRSRWGVCNRRAKTITLNTLLLEYDTDIIDYVIIHEMCHFFEGNHGPKFWSLVGQACPRYKELRKKLKE